MFKNILIYIKNALFSVSTRKIFRQFFKNHNTFEKLDFKLKSVQSYNVNVYESGTYLYAKLNDILMPCANIFYCFLHVLLTLYPYVPPSYTLNFFVCFPLELDYTPLFAISLQPPLHTSYGCV